MKKFLTCLISIFCIVSLNIPAAAYSTDTSIITIDNIDVIFNDDSSFSTEEKQIIAESIVYHTANAETYGLICNLFGHKNTTEVVITITHGVNATQPKCLKEYWEITTCSRCEHTEGTVIDSYYINCCE